MIQSSKTLYYTGNSTWSDDITEKKSYAARETLDVWIANEDSKSGGFKNATVVEE